MQAGLVTNGEVPWIVERETTYWVRVWTPPPADRYSWLVDEWRVSDAPDVLAVIDWAREKTPTGGTCEVLVESTDHAQGRDAVAVEVKRHLRVYGGPADDGGVTERIVFTAP